MKKLAIILLTLTSSAFAQDVITNEIQITNNDISIRDLNDIANETFQNSENLTIQEPLMTDELEQMYTDVQSQSENLEIKDTEIAQQLEESQDEVGVSYDTSNNTSDACGIWMCLPMGFRGSECEGPHREFHKRVSTGRSPLPSLSSCMSNQSAGNSTFSSNEGIAAFVPKHKIKDQCIKYTMDYTRVNTSGTAKVCLEYTYKYVDDSYVRGKYCIHNADGHGNNNPAGCTSTVKWIEVLNNNEKVGSTYYY